MCVYFVSYRGGLHTYRNLLDYTQQKVCSPYVYLRVHFKSILKMIKRQETEALQKALLRPGREQKGNTEQKKESGFRLKTLEQYTWGGLLKKVYEHGASLKCCEKTFRKASTARDPITKNHKVGNTCGFIAPNAVIVGLGKKKETLWTINEPFIYSNQVSPEPLT